MLKQRDRDGFCVYSKFPGKRVDAYCPFRCDGAFPGDDKGEVDGAFIILLCGDLFQGQIHLLNGHIHGLGRGKVFEGDPSLLDLQPVH